MGPSPSTTPLAQPTLHPPIRVITVQEPWAYLLAIGAKGFETRSWPTQHRGRIAIHAAKVPAQVVVNRLFPAADKEGHPDREAKARFLDVLAASLPMRAGQTIEDALAELPTGAIIATASLTGCYQILQPGPVLDMDGREVHPSFAEQSFGDWAPGRYAWRMEDVVLCDPVPANGQLGIWTWRG